MQPGGGSESEADQRDVELNLRDAHKPGIDPLACQVKSSPARPLLWDPDRERFWTVREFDRIVESVGSWFARQVDDDGSGGNRIAWLLTPRHACAALFYASLRHSWTTVPLDPRADTATLEEQLDAIEPSIMIGSTDTEELAVAVAPCPVASVDGSRFAACFHPDVNVDASASRSESGSESTYDPAETALIMFTSGSSGKPAGVRLTGDNLVASAMASAWRLGHSPDDRWLSCLPVNHMGGFAPMVRSVVNGSSLVFQESFDPPHTLAALQEHKITHVSLVPTQLVRVLEYMDNEDGESDSAASVRVQNFDRSQLRVVLLGGAPAREELLERAWAANLPAHPTYGMTETASQVATASPTIAREHRGTVGTPLPGTQVQIVDAETPVGADEIGEIVVTGPTVTPGYLDGWRTQKKTSSFGFHTGDRGYVDEAGRLWVVGRLDDVIQTGGEQVAPELVQEAIESHPAVAQAAVVGLDDAHWGERVATAVVVENGLETDAIRAHCRERVPDYAIPKSIAIVSEIPRTTSGTVDRERTRALIHSSGERFG